MLLHRSAHSALLRWTGRPGIGLFHPLIPHCTSSRRFGMQTLSSTAAEEGQASGDVITGPDDGLAEVFSDSIDVRFVEILLRCHVI